MRHEDIARVEGSSLRYPDQGHLPVVDLGGNKQSGWGAREDAVRPKLGARRNPWPLRRPRSEEERHVTGKMSRADYDNLVRRLRRILRRALPAESTVLAVSKGDARLLTLDCRAAWHFPMGEEGGWAGYHPRDGSWAVERLEEMRARGADYLVLPVTSFWWLSRYPELAAWLADRCPVVFEDERTCAIFALGPYPAFYGRERDAEVNRHLHPV